MSIQWIITGSWGYRYECVPCLPCPMLSRKSHSVYYTPGVFRIYCEHHVPREVLEDVSFYSAHADGNNLVENYVQYPAGHWERVSDELLDTAHASFLRQKI